jgi:hypothetical protein
MERLTHGDKARRYGLGAGRSLRGFRRHVMQHNQDGIALVKLDIFGRSTTAELDTDLLGSSPPRFRAVRYPGTSTATLTYELRGPLHSLAKGVATRGSGSVAPTMALGGEHDQGEHGIPSPHTM